MLTSRSVFCRASNPLGEKTVEHMQIKEHLQARSEALPRHRMVLDPHDQEPERISFRHEVHGIVPGYLGHKPRARDTVGTSVVGFTGAYDHSPEHR